MDRIACVFMLIVMLLVLAALVTMLLDLWGIIDAG
jgi:hypothetical protein